MPYRDDELAAEEKRRHDEREAADERQRLEELERVVRRTSRYEEALLDATRAGALRLGLAGAATFVAVWALVAAAGLVGLVVALELLGVLALVHLWCRPDASLGKRLAWSLVLLIPGVGPLTYAAMFDEPPGPG